MLRSLSTQLSEDFNPSNSMNKLKDLINILWSYYTDLSVFFGVLISVLLLGSITVSYTHLTLPTIYSV